MKTRAAAGAGRVRVDCDLCGRRDARPALTENGYEIVRCRGCGFLYLDPAPAPEELNRLYQELVYADERSAVFAAGLRLLAARGIVPGALLDVGCAGGRFLELARDAGWQVAGVEISEDAAGRARAVTPDIQVGDFPDLPLAEATYDLVALWDVLEHHPRPSRVLQQAARVLRPGGHLLVHCPNAALALPLTRAQRLLRGPGFVGLDTPFHLCHFTAATLDRFLARAGFRTLGYHLSDVTPGGNVPFWAKRAYLALARGLHRVAGLNLGNNLLALAQREPYCVRDGP